VGRPVLIAAADKRALTWGFAFIDFERVTGIEPA
jgi:hypothetical protein